MLKFSCLYDFYIYYHKRMCCSTTTRHSQAIMEEERLPGKMNPVAIRLRFGYVSRIELRFS